MEEVMESDRRGFLRRHPWTTLAIGLMTVAVILAYLGMRMMSTAQPLSEAKLAAVTSGDQVEVALEVKEVKTADVLAGNLLERLDDKSYQRTSKFISVKLRSDTKLVMGERKDI